MIRIVVVLDVEPPRSPSELRAYFLGQIRAALLRTEERGLLDREVAAELWRALPEREQRQCGVRTDRRVSELGVVLAFSSSRRPLIRYLQRALSEAVHIGATDTARTLTALTITELRRTRGKPSSGAAP